MTEEEEISTTYAILIEEEYWPSRRTIFLSHNSMSCAVEQFHSDASLEAVDQRAPNNLKNWQWTAEGDVTTRLSTISLYGDG